jgi:hypothetical protein
MNGTNYAVIILSAVLVLAAIRMSRKNARFRYVSFTFIGIGISWFLFYFLHLFFTLSVEVLNIWARFTMLYVLGTLTIWSLWLADE